MKKMILWVSIFATLLALNTCSESEELSWCETRTIASILALEGKDPQTNWCATVDAKLVYKQETTKGCRAGAYYLEDNTGSIFVCDPEVSKADSARGIVTCPSGVKSHQQDTTLEVSVRAQGLFYPAKVVCSELLCPCQNGLEVNQIAND